MHLQIELGFLNSRIRWAALYPVVLCAEFPQLPPNYLANSKISLNEDWGMYEFIQPSWTEHHRTATILTKKKSTYFLTKPACSDRWLINNFLPEKKKMETGILPQDTTLPTAQDANSQN